MLIRPATAAAGVVKEVTKRTTPGSPVGIELVTLRRRDLTTGCGRRQNRMFAYVWFSS